MTTRYGYSGRELSVHTSRTPPNSPCVAWQTCWRLDGGVYALDWAARLGSKRGWSDHRHLIASDIVAVQLQTAHHGVRIVYLGGVISRTG